MDADPAQLRVLSGTATVTTDGSSGTVTVKRNEVLPLSVVLVPEEATRPAADDFNTWAMNRSSVVSEDNTIAAGIIDDPDKIDNSGVAVGGFTYFPQTGIPLLGIDYPYGLSFWSPYQTAYNPFLSISPYGFGYPLYRVYPGSPFGTSIYPRPTFPRPVGTSPGIGIGRPLTPVIHPRPSLPATPRAPTMAVPHPPTPHVIRR
jgi:hypothetical protein